MERSFSFQVVLIPGSDKNHFKSHRSLSHNLVTNLKSMRFKEKINSNALTINVSQVQEIHQKELLIRDFLME